MTRLLDWIIGREPVLTSTGVAAVVTAVLGVLAAANIWEPDPELVAAIGALVAALAGFAARPAVSPTTTPALRRLDRASPPPPIPTDTVADDSRLGDS